MEMETTKRLFAAVLFLFIVALYILIATPEVNAAGNCSVNIESTDAMQFNTSEITIPKSCSKYTVNLKHTGKMPKNVMGHNVVISKVKDQKAVIDEGLKAGADNNYVKQNDARVLLATKIIGGGESTSAVLTVDKLSESSEYVFFCSFPGHAFAMKGTVKLI